MKAIRAYSEILTNISAPLIVDEKEETSPGVTVTKFKDTRGWDELKHLERIARTCYKSEGSITEDSLDSAKALLQSLINRGHEAMLEHGIISVKFVVDRAVSHELVRHRMASFAQESQRYCNYSKSQFDGEVTFIIPSWMTTDDDDLGYLTWREACLAAEKNYFLLLKIGYLPEHARSVLPNTTKTEVIVTANYREWRHIFKLRTDKAAHPDMRAVMRPLLDEMKARLPIIFDDITYKD